MGRAKLPDYLLLMYGARFQQIVSTGKALLSATAIVNANHLLTEKDYIIALDFIRKVAPTPEDWPETGRNWYDQGGSYEHLLLTSEVANQLAKKLSQRLVGDADVGNIQPEKMRIVGLFHDMGRLVTHQFYITDIVTDALMQQIGVIPSITNSLHKIDWYWGDDKLDFEQINSAQRISVISDTLAKRHSSQSNRLRRPHEVIDEVKKSKAKYLTKEPKNEFETKLVNIMESYTNRERLVISNVLEWIKKYSIDIEELLVTVEQEILR